MSTISSLGTFASGNEMLDVNIIETLFVDGTQGKIAISLNGPNGGVAAYAVEADGSLTRTYCPLRQALPAGPIWMCR